MRTALITGASRNIGEAIATRFVNDGWKVALVARTRTALEAAADRVGSAGGIALPIACDVTSPADVDATVATAVRELGSVDVLIHNAVSRVERPITEMTFEEWRSSIDVCLDGAFNCSKAVAPHMIAQQFGRIVVLAGISGQTGRANRIGMVTAKSGLLGFVKGLAHELGGDGVTVNAVSPGLIATDRQASSMTGAERSADEWESYYRRHSATFPIPRPGQPDEIAAACAFLASDQAAYITGQTLSVNGGAHM